MDYNTENIDDLKALWEEGKNGTTNDGNVKEIIKKADIKKRNSLIFQFYNIAILSVTAIGIYLFFWKLFPYNNFLSKAGVVVMIGSLIVRIIIEVVSVGKWKSIRIDEPTLLTQQSTINYLRHRKWIHGPVTYSIVLIYSMAFFCLMPEFSQHAPLWLVIYVFCSYPIGGYILIKQTRKGIRREMDDIAELVRLNSKLQPERRI